uniref:Uncharacterized protein n=1 Tax=Oryza rufipogon TaxID=4529 RepID=A0A0E0P351_ORYRU
MGPTFPPYYPLPSHPQPLVQLLLSVSTLHMRPRCHQPVPVPPPPPQMAGLPSRMAGFWRRRRRSSAASCGRRGGRVPGGTGNGGAGRRQTATTARRCSSPFPDDGWKRKRGVVLVASEDYHALERWPVQQFRRRDAVSAGNHVGGNGAAQRKCLRRHHLRGQHYRVLHSIETSSIKW